MMKNLWLSCFLAFILLSCQNNGDTPIDEEDPAIEEPVPDDKNYEFADGQISREVLNNYLMRAITQTEYLSSVGYYIDPLYNNVEDDKRMLLNLKAKFIGRAIYRWGSESGFNNSSWLETAKSKAEEIHSSDPTVIFQAALFEIVTDEVNRIPIPDWVFEAFDLEVENRNFNFYNMKFNSGYGLNHWGDNTTIPDMSKVETQMFYYFMAVSYMKIGCEALHIGQVMLICNEDAKLNNGQTTDESFVGLKNLLKKIRLAALSYARRGTVLIDAHIPPQDYNSMDFSAITVCGNINVSGKLLLDFGSFPIRMKNREETSENKYPASLDFSVAGTDAI